MLDPRIGGLCFGAGRLGSTDPQIAQATVDIAWNRGVRYFDVAPAYALGECERRLGAALRSRPRQEYVLSTKVGRTLIDDDAEGYVFDYSADGVLRQIDDSLTRLQMSHIDMLTLHDLSARWHGDQLIERFNQAMAGAWPAMLRLREEGVVAALCLGVNDVAICKRFAAETSIDAIMLAGRVTLLDRSGIDSGFLKLAENRRLPVLAAAPFNSGILALGPEVERATYFGQPAPDRILALARRVAALCAQWNIPLIAAAAQFALRFSPIVAVVAGFQRPEQFEEAHEAMSLAIPTGFWDDLDVLHGSVSPPAQETWW